MDAALKKKWVAALRSGEFSQTRGWLKTTDRNKSRRKRPTWERGIMTFASVPAGYCCLGVLCEVAGLDPKGKLLTKRQLTKLNLSRNWQVVLSEFNDDYNWSFEKIATYIEKNEL